MRIIKFEFLKIITNRLFIITFLILWIFNLLFLGYQNHLESKNSISYQAYKILETDLRGKTHEEKGKYIHEAYERAKAINIIYNIQNNSKSEDPVLKEYANILREENKELYNKYYDESRNPIWRYTGDSDKEFSFLKKIKNDYDIVNNYQKSINDILEEANKLKSVSIFKSKDKVSFKNIIEISNVYQEMLNREINYEIGKGIEKVSAVGITDFCVFILVFIISMVLIMEEKEKNLFIIIKSTKKGQGKTIMSKITTLFITVVLINLLFYGTNYIYYLMTLGFGNLFSSIQSIPILLLSSIKVNILEYLMILFSTKLLYVLFLFILMLYLAIKCSHSSEILIILFFLIFINFLLYKTIDTTSSINLFKSFNLVSLVNTSEIFRIYDNLRFYNILVSKTSILLTLQVAMIFLLIMLSIIQYLKGMRITARENTILSKLKKFRIIKGITFNQVFCFETYKLLVVNKGFIIILLFGVFTFWGFKKQNFNISYNEAFYKEYMEVLSGDLTYKKEKLIQNTIKEYEKAEEQLHIINEKVQNGELSQVEGSMASQPYEDIIATRGIFERVKSKYEYIKKNKEASFVYDTGYNKLFRLTNSVHENDISLMIITIVMIMSLFIMEYSTGFIHILNTTKNGGVKTARNKVLVTLLACTIIYIISIIPEILEILMKYGLDNMNMSIISLEAFHNLPSSITILWFLIAFYIVRYISYILVILIIEYIALTFKNNIFAFIASIFILLMPFVMGILKISQSDVFPLMHLSIIGKNLYYIIFVPGIVIISIFLYNSIVRRLR